MVAPARRFAISSIDGVSQVIGTVWWFIAAHSRIIWFFWFDSRISAQYGHLGLVFDAVLFAWSTLQLTAVGFDCCMPQFGLPAMCRAKSIKEGHYSPRGGVLTSSYGGLAYHSRSFWRRVVWLWHSRIRDMVFEPWDQGGTHDSISGCYRVVSCGISQIFSVSCRVRLKNLINLSCESHDIVWVRHVHENYRVSHTISCECEIFAKIIVWLSCRASKSYRVVSCFVWSHDTISCHSRVVCATLVETLLQHIGKAQKGLFLQKIHFSKNKV